jgi:hypothetical protein
MKLDLEVLHHGCIRQSSMPWLLCLSGEALKKTTKRPLLALLDGKDRCERALSLLGKKGNLARSNALTL